SSYLLRRRGRLLFHNFDQVSDFADHALDRRRVLKFDDLVRALQAEAQQRAALIEFTADRAANALHLHGAAALSLRGFLCGRHLSTLRRHFAKACAILAAADEISDLQATAVRDLARRALFFQRVDRGAHHVVRVRRTLRLGDHVRHAQHFEHSAHRTAGDQAGTGRGCAQHHLACAPTAVAVMVQRTAFAERNADQRLLGFFRRLADRFRHFARLAVAEANAALLVANDDEGREREVLTALHDLGDAVDGDELINELALGPLFRTSVAVAVVAARATARSTSATGTTRTTASAAARAATARATRSTSWAF